MRLPDEDISFSGSCEMLERELTKSVAQVLHLLPGTHDAHRTLHEVGVELVLSVTFVRAADRRGDASILARQAADAVAAGDAAIRSPAAGGAGKDLAADYARARDGVVAMLLGSVPPTAVGQPAGPRQASTK